MSENFASRLAQANLASKNDIVASVKKTDFDNKLKHLKKEITSNKTKHTLVENEFKKLQTFNSCLFIGQSTTLLNISNNLLYFKKTRRY